MAYRGRRENASRSSYIQESGFSFLKLFKGSQIHEFGVLEFVKKILSALGENPGVDLGRTTFSLELLTTPGATQLEKQLLEYTNLGKFGVFSLKMHQFVRENLGSRR